MCRRSLAARPSNMDFTYFLCRRIAAAARASKARRSRSAGCSVIRPSSLGGIDRRRERRRRLSARPPHMHCKIISPLAFGSLHRWLTTAALHAEEAPAKAPTRTSPSPQTRCNTCQPIATTIHCTIHLSNRVDCLSHGHSQTLFCMQEATARPQHGLHHLRRRTAAAARTSRANEHLRPERPHTSERPNRQLKGPRPPLVALTTRCAAKRFLKSRRRCCRRAR
jgi:hypothetical protein